MPRNRAAEILYDSEAALRLVVSELSELGAQRRRNTPRGVLPWEDEDDAPGAGKQEVAAELRKPDRLSS